VATISRQRVPPSQCGENTIDEQAVIARWTGVWRRQEWIQLLKDGSMFLSQVVLSM